MKKDSVKQSDILYFLENIYPCNEWIIIFTVEIFYFNYSLNKNFIHVFHADVPLKIKS